jgi:hypothetical protein
MSVESSFPRILGQKKNNKTLYFIWIVVSRCLTVADHL